MPSSMFAAAPGLDLPPLFTAVRLRESGDAFAHACRIAPEAGAGTFVHVGRYDLVEFAVVLEPEEPLVSARRAFFAGMAAVPTPSRRIARRRRRSSSAGRTRSSMTAR